MRAARIAKREGKDPAKALRETEARDKRDHDRYSRLYGYDVNDYKFAALVVDAEKLEPGRGGAGNRGARRAKFRGAVTAPCALNIRETVLSCLPWYYLSISWKASRETSMK